MKLINTKDYLLLIDEEAEIKENTWYENKGELFLSDCKYDEGNNPNNSNPRVTNFNNSVIAYYPLIKEAKELDLPLLPNPFKENNIEELALNKSMFPSDLFEKMKKSSQNDYLLEEEFGLDNLTKYREVLGFIEGYKAAQSKQFSLEDMKKAFEAGANWQEGGTILYPDIHGFTQSLSTPQQTYPKEFIPEIQCILDIDGRTIVEKKLKTITNSEGKEELVGTFKY